jgi:hypothetical protein
MASIFFTGSPPLVAVLSRSDHHRQTGTIHGAQGASEEPQNLSDALQK